MKKYVVPAVAVNDTCDCELPGASSLHPPVTPLKAPQAPVCADRIVSYELPRVSAVRMPALGAVKRYHTAFCWLLLPQPGCGSPSVVAVLVLTLLV